MKIEEFLNKAKELNAKIELLVEADCNDADYIINVEAFSYDEFVKYNIQERYNMLKLFEDKDEAVWEVAEKVYDEDYCGSWHHEYTLTPQEIDMLAENWNTICDYIPYNVSDEWRPCHTVTKVELRIIIPYEGE